MSSSTEPPVVVADPEGEQAVEDRWDRIEEDSRRLPTHQAAFSPPRESIAPVLIAGLTALFLGLVSAFGLPLLGFLPKSAPTASHEALIDMAETVPSPSASPSSAAEKKLRQIPVSIYNATDDRERTTEFSSTLSQRGWIAGEMGVWSAEDPGRTTVYYGHPSLKAAATLLSQDLNGAKIAYDSSAGKTLYVVIGSGYQAG